MATAKLIIKDEVNVKIEGLELTERKYLSNKFKYEIPGARYLPAVRLGRWDGKVAYFQLGGSTYTNLLPEILPYLDERGYDIELDDQRDYQTQFEFTEVTESTFAHKVWPKNHPIAGQPVVLRDYQIEIINKFLSNPQCLQEIATGAGKTLITAALSWSCEPHGRTIVIVPNKSLVTQTEADYINLGLDVGVYFGDRKEFGRTHTICTWQSLNILLKGTKAYEVDITIHEFLQDVVCVMVDEVHMAKADALKTLLTGVMAHVPIRWGLTGTIPKEQYEFMSLKCSIGDVIGRLSASELQDQGVLSNCHVNILQLIDHVEYKDYQSELRYLLETEERLEYISKLIETIRATGNTLILVDRIAPGKALVEKIKDAVFVSGGTKADARKESYDEFATSDNFVAVATYGVAAVGINIPRIFNLVLIEPGKSFVRVIQSIGRGIRKAEDKDFVQIWDVTSTCKFAKRHLTTRKKFYTEANYPFAVEKTEWK
jgi:superfamily II DNA or RNA helicase